MSLLPTIVNWYGGKQKLARQIISVMPPHEHYVEVFMGSAAVFFNKPKATRNTINDFNGNLVNLFIQVRDNFDALAEKVYWTLYSREQYKKFYRIYENTKLWNDCSDLDRALMYLFLIRASFNSQIDTDFSASIDSNSANFNLMLIERMKLAREKLDSVVIENRDFVEIIQKYDRPGTLMFLDPPYWVTLEKEYYYTNSLSRRQHESLQYWLSECKCNWLMTYDDIPEIVEMYKDFHIQRLSVIYAINNRKGASHLNSTREIDELLISNFKMKSAQFDAFDEQIGSEVTEDEKTELHKIKLRKEQELEQHETIEPVRISETKDGQQDLFGS